MSNIEITAEDIEYAEKLLLQNGNKFDEEEKVPIIKCMDESIEVAACPGSGKTTTLLAKLCVLSNKMPFEDEKGIVIITHTNVAVEEIKKKLGFKSDIFFNYPNFFGTIHSFVDKYLAIPFYKETFNSNIKSIDDDLFYNKLIRKIIPFGKLDRFLYGRIMAIHGKEKLSKDKIVQLKTNFLIAIYMDLEKDQLVFKKDGKVIVKNPENDVYKELFQLFYKDMLKQGYLKYNDIYFLGKLYIQKHPDIIKFFSERFRYLFIDETQDNSIIQDDIIRILFEEGETIVQRFGDLNQGIYEEKNPLLLQTRGASQVFEISKSMRYSQSIANFIDPLRVFNNGKELVGNSNIANIVPHLIIYDKDKITEVKDTFIELIKQFDLKDDVYPFKAIGWVGYNKNPERVTIEKYFPQYISQKKLDTQNEKYNFHSCLKQNTKRKRTVGNVYSSILVFFSNYLSLIEVEFENQTMSKDHFEKYFKENHAIEFNKFRIQVYRWSKLIFSNNKEVYSEIKNYLKDLLKFFIKDKEINTDYFDSLFYMHEELNNEDYTNASSTYTKDGVKIITDTIHGVKGETHTATLYLQTFYKTNDIKRIINFVLKKNKKHPNAEEVKSLKMAYVGMSRATQLLCIAMESNCVNKKELEEINALAEKGGIAIVRI